MSLIHAKIMQLAPKKLLALNAIVCQDILENFVNKVIMCTLSNKLHEPSLKYEFKDSSEGSNVSKCKMEHFSITQASHITSCTETKKKWVENTPFWILNPRKY